MHHGQEIFLFFNRFGNKGFIGIFISNIITILIIYKTLYIIKKENIGSYKEFIYKIVGKKTIINRIINLIVDSFLLIGFYIMIAGFRAYFSQELKVNSYFASCIGAMLCFGIFSKKINGIVKINEILVPIIILLIIILGLVRLNTQDIYLGDNIPQRNKMLTYSTIYAGYNSITLIPMLISLKKYTKNKKDIVLVAGLCGLVLTTLGIIIFLLLNTIKLYNVEIPIIYIASEIGIIFKYLYGLVILTAILTSAVAEGYSFLQNTTKDKNEYKIMNLFICTTSIFISQIGFSKLVNILYPFFGYLSIAQVLLIFLR